MAALRRTRRRSIVLVTMKHLAVSRLWRKLLGDKAIGIARKRTALRDGEKLLALDGGERTDLCRLPHEDASFDAVLCCYQLEHIDDGEVDSALRELHRVLRHGGRLLLVNLTRPAPPLYEVLARHLGLPPPVELAPRVVRAGFFEVSRLPYRQGLFVSEVVRAVKLQDGGVFRPGRG
jgi:SAM-dependent methyltransferase